MFDARSMIRYAISFALVGALAGCAVETAPGPDGQGDPAPAPSAKVDEHVGTEAAQLCPVGGFDSTSQACLCKMSYVTCTKTCNGMPAGTFKSRCFSECADRYYMCLPG